MAIQTLNNNDSANVYRGVYFENYPLSYNHSANTDYINSERTTDFSISDTTSTPSVNAKLTGGNQPHNNLQPYITCYMWKRTA